MIHAIPSTIAALAKLVVGRKSLVAYTLLAVALPASGDIIQQSESFSIAMFPAPGTETTLPLFLDYFDPSVGTLDSVEITMSGNVIVQLFLPANFGLSLDGAFPIPYQYQIEVSHDIGASGFPMSFLNPSLDVFLGLAPGGTATSPFLTEFDFSHETTLTDFTDLSGLAPVVDTYTQLQGNLSGVHVPTSFLIGTHRSDFVSTDPFLVLLPSLGFDATLFGVPGAILGSVQMNGMLDVTYNYTPPDVTSVPEPGTLTLFGIGLLGLGFARRKAA